MKKNRCLRWMFSGSETLPGKNNATGLPAVKTKNILLGLGTGLLLLIGSETHAQGWSSAFSAGGANNQYGLGTSRDASNNRIMVGYYTNGAATFGTFSLANGGAQDGFVTSYNPSNIAQWAARISGTNMTAVKSVTTDQAGNVYVCGIFSGTCTFYHALNPSSMLSGTAHSTLATGSASNTDGFIAKYNSLGEVQWRTRFAFTSQTDGINNICFRNAMLVVTGDVALNTSIGPYALSTGGYLARVNPANGNYVWAYNCPTGSNSNAGTFEGKTGLCIGTDNSIYINTNCHSGSIVKGDSTSSITVYPINVGALYAKYTPNGVVKWARVGSGTLSYIEAHGLSMAVDDNNNLYMAGSVSSGSANGWVYFPKTSGSFSITATANNEAYIARINTTDGNAQWVKKQTAIDHVDLAAQNCGVVYASLNCRSGAIITGSNTSITPSTLGLHIAKFYSNGDLLNTAATVWKNTTVLMPAFVHYRNSSLDVIAYQNGSSTLPLAAGGSTTITSNYFDVFAGTITETNPFPAPSVSAMAIPAQICEGDPTTLTATVSGTGGPFTFSWEVYNNSLGAFVPFPGSINSTTLPLTASQYGPYVYLNPVLNMNFCAFRIVVTNCSGATYTAMAYFIVHAPIEINGQTTEETVCIETLPGPPADFSVSATNTWSYRWEVSCNGGASWSNCSTNTTLYSGYNTATLHINSTTYSMNGCLYRCVLDGNYCHDDTTAQAVLNVVTGCPKAEWIDMAETPGETGVNTALFYPNPTTGLTTLALPNGTGHRPVNLVIADMSGKILLHQNISGNRTDLQLGHFENGVYLYMVTDGQEIHKGKIVLAR